MKTSGRAGCRVQKHAGTSGAGTDWLPCSDARAWLYRRPPAPTSRPPSCEVPGWDLRLWHAASVTLWVLGHRRGPPAAAAPDVTLTQHRLKERWSFSVNLEKNLPSDPPHLFLFVVIIITGSEFEHLGVLGNITYLVSLLLINGGFDFMVDTFIPVILHHYIFIYFAFNWWGKQGYFQPVATLRVIF